MKRTTVDGVEYDCPMYLVRAGSGWQVRMPKEKTVYFADGVHGGAASAYAEAMKHRLGAAPVTNQKRGFPEAERQSKSTPTGTPGIYLVEHCKPGRTIPEYRLEVRVSRLPTRTIYISSGSLDQVRYEQKLEIAKTERLMRVAMLSKPVLTPLAPATVQSEPAKLPASRPSK